MLIVIISTTLTKYRTPLVSVVVFVQVPVSFFGKNILVSWVVNIKQQKQRNYRAMALKDLSEVIVKTHYYYKQNAYYKTEVATTF